MSEAADAGLLELLATLSAAGYRFVTPTPTTHRHYLERQASRAGRDLRDTFGWSMPFAPADLPEPLLASLSRSGMLTGKGGLLRSKVRVSSLGARLFLHSAYPTDSADSVFFGPDTYRFARFLEAELHGGPPVRHVVDVGTGSGAGGIVAGALMPEAQLTLTDINPFALRLARVNALHAGLAVGTLQGVGLEAVARPFDLVIANPPFMADPASRAYRDGGGMHGAALSLAWAEDAARRLAPGGRMLLYTASAITGGEDRLEVTLRARLPAFGCALRYEEIDPDIFGDELDQPGYEGVERIAAVGAVIDKAKERNDG